MQAYAAAAAVRADSAAYGQTGHSWQARGDWLYHHVQAQMHAVTAAAAAADGMATVTQASPGRPVVIGCSTLCRYMPLLLLLLLPVVTEQTHLVSQW